MVSLLLVWLVFENVENINRQTMHQTFSVQQPRKLFELVRIIDEIEDMNERFDQMEIFLQALSTYLSLMSNKLAQNEQNILEKFDVDLVNNLIDKMNNWNQLLRTYVMNNAPGDKCIKVSVW